MAWVYLVIAGLLEVGWAVGLKYTEGFTRPLPSAVTLGLMVASFLLLSAAVKTLPVGTAYAVWTGIGTAGAALLGMLLLDEPRTAARLLFIGLVLAGVAGLRATGGQG